MELTPESAASPRFTELYSEFQLIISPSGHNVTVSVHSHRSHSIISRPQQTDVSSETNKQTADKHS